MGVKKRSSADARSASLWARVLFFGQREKNSDLVIHHEQQPVPRVKTDILGLEYAVVGNISDVMPNRLESTPSSHSEDKSEYQDALSDAFLDPFTRGSSGHESPAGLHIPEATKDAYFGYTEERSLAQVRMTRPA